MCTHLILRYILMYGDLALTAKIHQFIIVIVDGHKLHPSYFYLGYIKSQICFCDSVAKYSYMHLLDSDVGPTLEEITIT